MICPHCSKPIFRKSNSGDRLKARTRIIVLHRNRNVEFNCPECGNGIMVGRLDNIQLEKAQILPRLVIKTKKTLTA